MNTQRFLEGYLEKQAINLPDWGQIVDFAKKYKAPLIGAGAGLGAGMLAKLFGGKKVSNWLPVLLAAGGGLGGELFRQRGIGRDLRESNQQLTGDLQRQTEAGADLERQVGEGESQIANLRTELDTARQQAADAKTRAEAMLAAHIESMGEQQKKQNAVQDSRLTELNAQLKAAEEKAERARSLAREALTPRNVNDYTEATDIGAPALRDEEVKIANLKKQIAELQARLSGPQQ